MRRRSTHSAQYRAHLQSPEWRAIREAALERAGHSCALCGRSIEELRRTRQHLEIHHRHYRSLEHEAPGDITVLCAPGGCHAIADQQRRALTGMGSSGPVRKPAKRRGRKRRLPKPLRDLRNAALGLGSVIVLLKLAAITLPT